jgi:hypothetical protein
VPTADSDDSTVTPTDGSATDTSNGTPATESDTESTTNEPTTATTSIVDPTTGDTTNNPVTSLDTSTTEQLRVRRPAVQGDHGDAAADPAEHHVRARQVGLDGGDAERLLGRRRRPEHPRHQPVEQPVPGRGGHRQRQRREDQLRRQPVPVEGRAVSVYNAGACPVLSDPEVPVAASNAANILAAIPMAGDTSIKGGTPSAAGVTTALNHLKSINDGAPKAIFLVTDGAANCDSDAPSEMARFEVYDDSLHTIVNDAFMVDGIPTYVIGIDIDNMVTSNMQDGNPNGINPFEKLNELATLGGKPKGDPNEKFYNAVNQIELQAALDVIVSDA